MIEMKDKELQTVGIAVDHYKLKRFESELTKIGFTNLIVTKLSEKMSFISIKEVPDARIGDIHKLCERLQNEFKQRN